MAKLAIVALFVCSFVASGWGQAGRSVSTHQALPGAPVAPTWFALPAAVASAWPSVSVGPAPSSSPIELVSPSAPNAPSPRALESPSSESVASLPSATAPSPEAAPASDPAAGADSASNASAGAAANAQSDPATSERPHIDGPEKGSNEWEAWASGAVPFKIYDNDPEAHIWAAGGRYGRVLTDAHGPFFLRGRLEWAIDVIPVMFVHLPQHTVYTPGFAPFIWKWDFVTHQRLSPFFELSGGALYGNQRVVPGSSQFNFMPSLGLGVSRPWGRSGKFSWTFDVRFFHISNAGITPVNPGLNSIQIRLGFGLFTHPKR